MGFKYILILTKQFMSVLPNVWYYSQLGEICAPTSGICSSYVENAEKRGDHLENGETGIITWCICVFK